MTLYRFQVDKWEILNSPVTLTLGVLYFYWKTIYFMLHCF